jgi:hypothetical protein
MKFSRIFVAVFAFSSLLLAQEAASPKPAKAKKPTAHFVMGTVISVDAVGNMLVIKAKKGEDTIYTESSTKIMSGKKDITISDIKTDSKVTISYKPMDGKKMAVKIVEKASKDESKPATK